MVKKEGTAAYIVIGAFVLLGISLLYGGNGCGGKSHRNKTIRTADRKNEQKPNVAEAKVAKPKYTIVSIKNVSYSIVKRYDVRVRVGYMLSNNELKQVSEAIVEELKLTRPHNALMLFYYLPDSDTNGMYTAGKAEWAPYGDWSRADEAHAGNYSNHILRLFPGNATGFDPEKSRVPGFSVETKKRIFFELVAAQDRGVGDNEAYGIIAKKFSVAETTVRKISIEGIANGWPMP